MTTFRINGVLINAVEEHYRGFWQKAAEGRWEPSTYAVIDRYVTPDTVFFDIGSHIGAVALYAATRAARVICVEADPLSLGKLRANVAANPHVADRITIIAKAIYPTHDPIVFGSRGAGGDSMSSFALHDLQTTWNVETITPTELAAMMPPDAPVFVKMDIEGGEYVVVPDAHAFWSRPDLVLLLSTHSQLFRWPLRKLGIIHKSRRVFNALRGYDVARVDDRWGAVPRRSLSVTERVRLALGFHQVLLFTSAGIGGPRRHGFSSP